MLPRVKINFENGALGSVAPSEDGVIGLIVTGYAVTDFFELNKPYLITSYADLKKLGITGSEYDSNKLIDKCVREIYSEAPNGTKVWLMGVSNITTQEDMCDVNGVAKSLLVAARGAINILVIKCETDTTIVTIDGIYTELPVAINKAQALAEWATTDLFAPCFVLLEGRGYTGDALQLAHLSERDDNRVADRSLSEKLPVPHEGPGSASGTAALDRQPAARRLFSAPQVPVWKNLLLSGHSSA